MFTWFLPFSLPNLIQPFPLLLGIWTNVIWQYIPQLRYRAQDKARWWQGAMRHGQIQAEMCPLSHLSQHEGVTKIPMAIKYQIVTISEIYSVTILRFLRTQHFMLTVTVGCCALWCCGANLILHSKKHKNVKTLHFPLILHHVLWWQPIEMQSWNQVIKTTGPNFVFDWIFVEYLRYRRIAWEMRIKRFAKTHIFASTIIWKINIVVEISNNVPYLSTVQVLSIVLKKKTCNVWIVNVRRDTWLFISNEGIMFKIIILWL